MAKQSGNQGGKGSKSSSRKNPIVSRAIKKNPKTSTKSQEKTKAAAIKANLEEATHPQNANVDSNSGSNPPPAVELACRMVKVMSVFSKQVKYVHSQTSRSQQPEESEDDDEPPEEPRIKTRFDSMKYRPPTPPGSRSPTSKNASKSRRHSSPRQRRKHSTSSQKSGKASGRERTGRKDQASRSRGRAPRGKKCT